MNFKGLLGVRKQAIPHTFRNFLVWEKYNKAEDEERAYKKGTFLPISLLANQHYLLSYADI